MIFKVVKMQLSLAKNFLEHLVIKRAVRIFVLPPVSLHPCNVRICIVDAFNDVTRYWSSLSSLIFGFHEPHFIPARQRRCIAGCCFSLVPLYTA